MFCMMGIQAMLSRDNVGETWRTNPSNHVANCVIQAKRGASWRKQL